MKICIYNMNKVIYLSISKVKQNLNHFLIIDLEEVTQLCLIPESASNVWKSQNAAAVGTKAVFA